MINSVIIADDKFIVKMKNSNTKFISRLNRNEKVPSVIELSRSSTLSRSTITLVLARLLVLMATTAMIDAKYRKEMKRVRPRTR